MADKEGSSCGCEGGGPDWAARMTVITSHLANPSPVSPEPERATELDFAITFPALPEGKTELDGRLLLLIAPAGSDSQPRFMVSADGLDTAQVFGVDVNGWLPNVPASITTGPGAFGAPLRSTAELPPGTYDAQCVLQVYETFNLSTGHTVKLPMDRGEGQKWNAAPGNLYSPVFPLVVAAGQHFPVQSALSDQ
jgi:hypothetical protein